ncbi:cobalamin biosynthesis protein CbiM [Paenibacillus swuensis]|uniref:Cobalamin biosynthesis protein CbiM n=1 Tax=Paenibacillus swuensis TaxID=1178515 RepID=A0A172TH70_9BACL|nr:energy-coupling factor ABC transporter permease [Paenibacillus swuensis]ANE46207.1 cobalamin biosynthesis protein CbiM [Paenibacillus swuensis]
MHIPDGFLDTKTWVTTTAAGACALGYALNKSKLELSRKQVPTIALVGSFIFAAQMINFPIAGATSGHFLGGTLASILFGPAVGIIIMAAVLIIQAFFFQDGGITVLGANILCTGVIGSLAGYGMYRLGMGAIGGKFRFAVTFISAWFSLVLAAASVSLLLIWSGYPAGSVFTAMVGWHSIIGIGEGAITAMVAAYLVERKITIPSEVTA